MKKTLQPLYKQEYESERMFQERIEKRKQILRDGGYRDGGGFWVEVDTGVKPVKQERPLPQIVPGVLDEEEEGEPEDLREYLEFLLTSPNGKKLFKKWAGKNEGAACKFAIETVQGKAVQKIDIKSTSLTMLQVNPTPTEIELLRRQVLKTLEAQTVEMKRLPAPVLR